MKIKIGTRKSRLAVAQTNMFIERLTSFFPDAEPEIIYISTKGDKIIDKPLSQIGGKGIFVSEIELALQCGNIDVAVHSAKDLPVLLGENLDDEFEEEEEDNNEKAWSIAQRKLS